MKHLLALVLILALSGCETLSTGGPSERQLAILPFIQNYQMPVSPIPCTDNPVAEVDTVMKNLFLVATARGFMVDGSHAKDGVLIFSRAGSAGPMMVGVAVFKEEKTGKIATQESYQSKGPDMKACLAFHSEVVRLITQG